jgi:hypothetical protein
MFKRLNVKERKYSLQPSQRSMDIRGCRRRGDDGRYGGGEHEEQLERGVGLADLGGPDLGGGDRKVPVAGECFLGERNKWDEKVRIRSGWVGKVGRESRMSRES